MAAGARGGQAVAIVFLAGIVDAVLDLFEDTFGGRCPVFEIAHRIAIVRSIFGADTEDNDMKDVDLAIAEEVDCHA